MIEFERRAANVWWRNAAKELPPKLRDVLIAVDDDSEDGLEVDMGFLGKNDLWYYSGTPEAGAIRVSWWAFLPDVPREHLTY